MLTFSFLNQTLWCDPHRNRLSETIAMDGNIIGFGWEIRKLAYWKLSTLDRLNINSEINVDPDQTEQLWVFLDPPIWPHSV